MDRAQVAFDTQQKRGGRQPEMQPVMLALLGCVDRDPSD